MTDTRHTYAAIERHLSTDSTVAVATIVRTRGSSPREVGAKMIVRPSGDTDGTVGGGCGEAEVWRAALEVVADRQPRTVVVDLTEDIAMTTDGVCGGVLDIFVEPWSANGAAELGDARAFARAMIEAADARVATLTATVVDRRGGVPVGLGSKLLLVNGTPRLGQLGWPVLQQRVLDEAPAVVADGKSQTRVYTFEADAASGLERGGQVSLFYEVTLPKPTLIVVGAGHVAVPIAQIASMIDFDVVVIDDRPSFANKDRFPGAREIIVDDFETALAAQPITPSTYVVLVTRGHVHDVRSLRSIVDKPAAYVGMIGSRRRVFAVFKLLHGEGVPIETLLRIRAPIGLDINTETPAEIAVSVVAEMMRVRRGGGAASFSELLRDQYRYSLTRDDTRNGT